MDFDRGLRRFSSIEGNTTNKCIYTFSFLVGKHLEPQSINAKLFLPVIPIVIVAYAFTLLWDNLCQNGCVFAAILGEGSLHVVKESGALRYVKSYQIGKVSVCKTITILK